MSNTSGPLSDDDVRRIALLVETLEKSSFDFLQLESGDLKVTIGKGAPPDSATAPGGPASAPAGPAAAPRELPAQAVPRSAPAPATAVSATAAATNSASKDSAAQAGTVPIVAPMLGRFYAQPEPGAAPFVSVGAKVNADTTVALIEVMKVFTAVQAGVSGVITEICVQNEQFVEYGQVLFRVRPAAAAAGATDAGAGPRH